MTAIALPRVDRDEVLTMHLPEGKPIPGLEVTLEREPPELRNDLLEGA